MSEIELPIGAETLEIVRILAEIAEREARECDPAQERERNRERAA